MQFTLNGVNKNYEGDKGLPLLTYLREIEGITSAKDGCAPQAACGACTVELNGKAVLSCVIPMSKVENGIVVTTEGLEEYKQRVITNAFVEKCGVQCGFCIPGIVMQANVLIDNNPKPSRNEIERALTPNLCRSFSIVLIQLLKAILLLKHTNKSLSSAKFIHKNLSLSLSNRL